MRKSLQLTCPVCGKQYDKAMSEIKRNELKGRLNFCSISCAATYRNLHPGKSVLDAQQKFANTFGKSKKIIVKVNDELQKFKYALSKTQSRSSSKKRKPLENTLTLQDLQEVWNTQKGKCVYSGVDLILPARNKRIPHIYEASIDRIDSSKGYNKNNIQFISVTMNYMKNTMTDIEVKKYLKEIALFTSTFMEGQTISSSHNEMSDALAGN